MDFLLAQAAYTAKLKRALEIVTPQIPISGLELSVITVDALRSFRSEWAERERRVAWDWTESDFRPPKGLNLAIWKDGQLCGLACGKLGSSKAVRIEYVEAFPGENPLKKRIIPITLTCADAYRQLLGSKELKVCGVILPLVPIYASHGFELAEESREAHVVMRKAIP